MSEVLDAEIVGEPGTDVATTPKIEVRESPLDHVKLHLVDNIDDAWAFKRWMSERRPTNALACDTETASLNAYIGKPLRLVQFGDTKTGWAVPWELWGGIALEALNTWEGDWVWHNSRFDINWLRAASLRARQPWHPQWHRMHDTLTQAHLDDPTRSRGLKPLGGMLIDQRAASSQAVLDKEMNLNNWDWESVPIVRTGAGSSYWIYGALDPVLTANLHDIFEPVRRDFHEAYELEMGTVRCIADMEWRGALVDVDYCRMMMERIEVGTKKIREWIREAYGIANATSTMQCIAKFEELGREITTFTKGGSKSLDKEQLQKFLIERDENGNELPGAELARQILKLRRGEKFTGPYFKNFEKYADANNIVHPTIWPCGTRTARMSIQDPALQTMPRKDPTVRDAFVPSEGNVLMAIDADQIELRLAAHFSQDAGLRAAFMESPDVFNTIATEAWGRPISKKDEERQYMKNGVYGKLYGASVFKIALTTGVPVAQMQRVMAQFDESYPGIARLQQAIISVGRQRSMDGGRPYINTPTGRRLYGDKGKEYTLTNYLIQSHAAEILKKGINDLHSVGLGPYLILPVHDELVLDVPRENYLEVKQLLEDTLNAVGKDYFIPLTWSADVMFNRWGDKYRAPDVPKELVTA